MIISARSQREWNLMPFEISAILIYISVLAAFTWISMKHTLFQIRSPHVRRITGAATLEGPITSPPYSPNTATQSPDP